MGRLVTPELQSSHKFLPRVFAEMKQAGKEGIVLAIDNTSRQNFGGVSFKLEQAVIKIVLPGIDSAYSPMPLPSPYFSWRGTRLMFPCRRW
jgi:hypothetical protein